MAFFTKAKEYAPIVVRYSMGLVFLFIAIDQFLRPGVWLGYFPSWITNFGTSISTFMIINKFFDLIIGILLLLGLLTRIVAIIAVLHLLGVLFALGYNDIAIRDFGILLTSFSIFLNGKDKYCLDSKIWKK